MKRAFASVGIASRQIPMATRLRFLAKFEYHGEDACWPWTASRTHQGYGRFGLPGHGCTTAQRVAYALFVGDLKPGLTIDHLCENPGCVNPRHLQAVPHRVNVLRSNGVCAQHARRTHCIKGHPLALYDGPNHKQRYCPICKRETGRNNARRYRAAKKEAAA